LSVWQYYIGLIKYEKNRLSAVGLNIEVGFAHMHSQEKCIWVNMKLEPWSIGWGYTEASSLYSHKIKANGPGVKL